MKSVEKRTANLFHLLSHNKSQLFSQMVQHFIYGLTVSAPLKMQIYCLYIVCPAHTIPSSVELTKLWDHFYTVLYSLSKFKCRLYCTANHVQTVVECWLNTLALGRFLSATWWGQLVIGNFASSVKTWLKEIPSASGRQQQQQEWSFICWAVG